MIALNDTQLVIIDIQGKLSQIVHESERVLYNSRIMIEGCRLLGIPINALLKKKKEKACGHLCVLHDPFTGDFHQLQLAREFVGLALGARGQSALIAMTVSVSMLVIVIAAQ